MDANPTSFAGSKTLNLVMLWLFCVTLALLFLPLEMVSLELADQVAANRTYLYLALIVEVSNFLAQGIFMAVSYYLHQRQIQREQEAMKTTVSRLDFAERALLREFVLQRKSVLNLPEAEPSVRSLLDSNVLQIVGEHEEDTTRAPMIITKQARPFITYRAIGLTRSKMNDQMLEQIMNARPDFAREKKTQPRAYRGIKAA